MDLLRNYADFRQDIEQEFQPLIKEFGLQLHQPYEGLYLLKGKKCSLRFTYDRGDLRCQFKHQYGDLSAPGFDVGSVYRFFYPPHHKETGSSDWGSPKEQLSNYANIIQNHFKNVMNGDFGWLNPFLEWKAKEDKLSMYVCFNLSPDHPISKKLRSGDETWSADLEKYLFDNKIKL